MATTIAIATALHLLRPASARGQAAVIERRCGGR